MQKTNYFLCLVATALLSTSCSLSERHELYENDDALELARSSKSSCTASIIDVVNGITDAGVATLRRNKKKLSMNFKVEGLTPGYAYTVWWVIWNSPENCATPNACLEPDFAKPVNIGVTEVHYN